MQESTRFDAIKHILAPIFSAQEALEERAPPVSSRIPANLQISRKPLGRSGNCEGLGTLFHKSKAIGREVLKHMKTRISSV